MATVREVRAARAVELAGLLLALSRTRATPTDDARARMLARMLRDPDGRALTNALTDRLFRSAHAGRQLDEVAHLLTRHGVPEYMRVHERASLKGVQLLAPLHMRWLARAVARRIREETRSVLLDAEDGALSAHLALRHREGVRVNVNQLGEALLGEREAEARVAKYEKLAARADVDALSVKVSSIASQLEPLAFDASAQLIAERLARIYAASLHGAGRTQPIVMLDMESYAHVALTLESLRRALADTALDRVRAGVVVQAYLPEASALLREVRAFAEARLSRGGVPLRVRIVKGANLASERVESDKAGVSVPIFASKREVDANYKRLLEQALTPEACRTVQLGVASHNLFDLSYALLLCEERELDGACELELLEGMADPVRRALSALGVPVLVYAPICHADELNSGIAYLVRRLDENTASDNYLQASFSMTPDSPAFERERARFMASIASIDAVRTTPRRAGEASFDRTRRRRDPAPARAHRGETDTDFSRSANRAWIQRALEAQAQAVPPLLASRIAGADVVGDVIRDGSDPSRPGHVPYRVALADDAAIERALACAAHDRRFFSSLRPAQRAHLLTQCAGHLREARAELIATLVLDGGKRVAEADVEVSEAIDFATYYRDSTLRLLREHAITLTPRGVVLVTPPWNFPLAIAAGGILAALMAGCRVLFKPALETPLVGTRLAQLLWRAGVPEEALQLILCADETASALVRDARVDAVILTGATSTARLFQKLRPGLRLLAETSGKNAYGVSAMSDRDIAIRDVVQSAFGHAGQKCSAASLLICEAEVHDDPRFVETLRDAVQSLPVGSAWDAQSFVTPLIHPPEGALARALTQLEPGERWLVEPKVSPDNPCLVSPGVKLGVRAGSFTHTTELFGPVLGVMRAESLTQAIGLANATGYGLTAGFASLDEREQEQFLTQVAAGNVYVNRTITGAIVGRQPFGGIGKSGFGPGAKAGGPNYVLQLCRVHAEERLTGRATTRLPEALEARTSVLSRALGVHDARVLRERAHDYATAMRDYFGQEHDPSALLGQQNRFRYLPCPDVVLRIEEDASLLDVASSCLAAVATAGHVKVSIHPHVTALQDTSLLGYAMHVETSEAMARRPLNATRIRVLGTRTPALDAINASTGAHIADDPVVPIARVELLHYLMEQTLSIEVHRYGNLPVSSGEPRAEGSTPHARPDAPPRRTA